MRLIFVWFWGLRGPWDEGNLIQKVTVIFTGFPHEIQI